LDVMQNMAPRALHTLPFLPALIGLALSMLP